MNVFVWVNNGKVEVYAADNANQLTLILDLIRTLIIDWNMEAQLQRVDKYLYQYPMDPYKLTKSIKYLLNEINIGSNKNFEYGTGFTTLLNIMV